jgi:hypothetical protein
MSWQLPVVVVLLVLAASYVGYRTWRTWFGKAREGCGGSCGCGKKAPAQADHAETLISEDQLLARLRR